MNDYIRIKAINTDLLWNQSIGSLMNHICYRIGFDYKTISLYVGRGLLNDTIEFWNAEAGVYDLNSINTEYFNKLHFASTSQDDQITNHLLEINPGIYMISKGARTTLDVYYIGNNKPITTEIQLFSNSIEPNFECVENWKFEINQIRKYLSREDHGTYFDWNKQIRRDRKGIQFRELSVFGITSDKFTGWYDPVTNQLTNLELIMGADVLDYYQFRDVINSTIHNLPLSTKPMYLDSIQHLEVKDIWEVKGLVIELRSAGVPHTENRRYELQITGQETYWRYHKRS